MSPKTIQSRVLDVLKYQSLGHKKIEINGDSTFEDLDIDPLDLVSIITNMENEFDLAIWDEDGLQWKSVQDIVAYIERK